jgi:flagellar basal-body rod protein FlgB
MIEYLEAGLRATSVRQAVIANNLANLATSGYRRKTVPFEDLFAEAIERGRPVSQDAIFDRIAEPRTAPINEHGTDVELDVEVGELVKNSLRYKAYMRILQRAYRQMELAMANR